MVLLKNQTAFSVPFRGTVVLVFCRYGPPTRTEYRLIVENLSSRVSWQVRPTASVSTLSLGEIEGCGEYSFHKAIAYIFWKIAFLTLHVSMAETSTKIAKWLSGKFRLIYKRPPPPPAACADMNASRKQKR